MKISLSIPTSYFLLPISYQRGQAMLVAVVFMLMALTLIVFGAVGPTLADVQAVRDGKQSRQSYFASEALIEDVVYRKIRAMSVDDNESLTFATTTVAATVTDLGFGVEQIRSRGDHDSAVRISQIELELGPGVSFNFGVQAGDGGLVLNQSASVLGNVYSNGPVIKGSGATGKIITGDVVSAGASGLVDGLDVSGDAYANTITDTTVAGTAYYDTTFCCSAGSTAPGSPDQPVGVLPIDDAMIDAWKADAAAGTIVDPCSSDPLVITTPQTIGPAYYNCSVTFSHVENTEWITLQGTLWIEGDLLIDNSHVKVDPSLGNRSIAIIVDNESDRLTSSRVTVKSSSFFGTGGANSYILLLSNNESAELGGGEKAIDLQTTSDGDLLLYTPGGEVNMAQSSDLKEVTGWRIKAWNSTVITYESGVSSLLFSGGPSGGYAIGEWEEVE